ncbi:MAG: BatA domain-containing protein [Planctomycetota bacterium]|nr:BatA domain-containing protein [Planctomycetota bacterium]
MGAFLGTYFVTKWALLGALGIAAPILIWLINRFRTQVVEWAAIEFLRRAVQKARRRMRIEEILLLIIRCLIIILLAIVLLVPKASQKQSLKTKRSRGTSSFSSMPPIPWATKWARRKRTWSSIAPKMKPARSFRASATKIA